MKKLKFAFVTVMMLFVMCMCVGCKNDTQTYNEVIEKGKDSGAAIWNEEGNPLEGMNAKEKGRYIALKCLEVEKPVALVLIVLGQLFGWIVFKTATDTPNIRKFALSVLIIGIPILSLIVVGGTMAIARTLI